MRSPLILILLIMALTAKSQDNKLTIYVAPGVGFDVHKSTLYPPDRHKDYYSLDKPTSLGTAFVGIAVQAHLLEDWQVSARYSFGDLGAGYSIRNYIAANGGDFRGTRSSTSSGVRQAALTSEYCFKNIPIAIRQFPGIGVCLNAGLGLSYSYIPKVNRSDTAVPLPSLSISGGHSEKGWEYQEKSGAAGLLLGLNAQFYKNEHKYLKLGVWYQYMPNPPIYYRFIVQAPGQPADDFRLLVTQHQFCLFAEIPIRLFRLSY